jgi:hypothetical protein
MGRAAGLGMWGQLVPNASGGFVVDDNVLRTFNDRRWGKSIMVCTYVPYRGGFF